MNKTKPFEISRDIVWEAYRKVKANKGCAGVDDVSMKDFEENLDRNLYKIWNRMSSGCYFPSPVRVVEIPKGEKGVRRLGIPNILDRVAQMIVKIYLEPVVNPTFHEDSYGYRPNKSALDAVAKARQMCWKYDWVIDLDIKGFFDNIDHSLMMAIVRKHTEEKWILLYIERWLKAPAQEKGGEIVERNTGTPQGGVISPLLANMFLDYVFDNWMKTNHPNIPFERYADDVIIHCHIEDEPKSLLKAIRKRFEEFKLQLHPKKTKIVYCKDANRAGDYCNKKFDFLGFTFKLRSAKNKYGKLFVSFVPAISQKAAKAIRATIRGWKIGRRSDRSIEDIAKLINSTVRGWINYYGKFHKTALQPIFRKIETSLIKWVMRKFKNCRAHFLRAVRLLGRIAESKPSLMTHWVFGVKSSAG